MLNAEGCSCKECDAVMQEDRLGDEGLLLIIITFAGRNKPSASQYRLVVIKMPSFVLCMKLLLVAIDYHQV
jgi:hypothetical protein